MALQEELKKQGDFLFKHRSYLPLVLLVVGLGVKIYQEKFVAESILSEVLESISYTVGLMGLGIRIFTVGYTPKNTSGRNTKEGQIADTLNTTGMYSIIRNPLYLGNYLMWVSVVMFTGNIGFVLLFSLVFWIYDERIVYAKESFLREKFGKTYLDWASHTPAFIPKHVSYVKPNIKFSWKKVAKKEKNGLFALFLLFWVFESVGEYVEEGMFVVEEIWLYLGTITTGILYLVLKYLKKHSNVLEEAGR
jgi:protein-S-isoprenylcysteine O-methyltransferase Ste14